MAPLAPLLRRFPNPRLTGIGAGLFAATAMFLLGCVDHLLFDDAPLVLGLMFLPVCALTALWVRPADLVTAPIGVPIAFAVGVVPIAGGSGGLGGQTMAVVTALAVHAGWLYGGTLVAGLIATVRKVRQMRERQYLRAVEALRTDAGSPGATAARAAGGGGGSRGTAADRPARGGAPAKPASAAGRGPAPAPAAARPSRRTSRR
ncbi:DUF6542 domain-containing protein [uncultured Streptomyces sp.]|uniref:DUF6542 domain-containing protein n=1 Tax=uncultured Streptomyces sp. TaxID=174707 RepID=UPI0026220EB7|nr:DUF6542 domain-containing protein [uncultured Streptomyces sp.]